MESRRDCQDLTRGGVTLRWAFEIESPGVGSWWFTRRRSKSRGVAEAKEAARGLTTMACAFATEIGGALERL